MAGAKPEASVVTAPKQMWSLPERVFFRKLRVCRELGQQQGERRQLDDLRSSAYSVGEYTIYKDRTRGAACVWGGPIDSQVWKEGLLCVGRDRELLHAVSGT